MKIKLVNRGRKTELQLWNLNKAAGCIWQGSVSHECLSYHLVMWSKEGSYNKHRKHFTGVNLRKSGTPANTKPH